MMNMQQNQMLPEKDLLNATLADLRRSVREYATATTEAACPMVRQMFTQLTDSSLKIQGELYQLMASNNMYNVPSKVQRQEVTKRLQNAQQTQTEAQQFVQQHLTAMGAQAMGAQTAVPPHQPNVGTTPQYS
ncbi:spore coat protein [Paenibacillus caui]|uniref:spore coat protein n=1 Tax=Paenibacillus caui TaxID=2873927 RepID=UPI001F162497|nr:spore coat protein [Paenibacillus caui]